MTISVAETHRQAGTGQCAMMDPAKKAREDALGQDRQTSRAPSGVSGNVTSIVFRVSGHVMRAFIRDTRRQQTFHAGAAWLLFVLLLLLSLSPL